MCFEMHRNTREARAIQVVLRGLVGDDRGVEEPELRLAASLMSLTNPRTAPCTNAGFPMRCRPTYLPHFWCCREF